MLGKIDLCHYYLTPQIDWLILIVDKREKTNRDSRYQIIKYISNIRLFKKTKGNSDRDILDQFIIIDQVL